MGIYDLSSGDSGEPGLSLGGSGIGFNSGGQGFSVDSIVNTFVSNGINSAIDYSLSIPRVGDGLGLTANYGSGLSLYDVNSGGGLRLNASAGSGTTLYQTGSGGGLGLDYGSNQGSIDNAAGGAGGSGIGNSIMNAINGLGSWANDNKVLAGLLGSGLLGALKGSNSPDYAAAIKEKEQVDLRTRQRISDSITGMKPITVNRPGLLQTMSGQNVYDQNGRIAR